MFICPYCKEPKEFVCDGCRYVVDGIDVCSRACWDAMPCAKRKDLFTEHLLMRTDTLPEIHPDEGTC